MYLVARLVATVIINIICDLFSPEFYVFRVPSRGGFILMFFLTKTGCVVALECDCIPQIPSY